MTTLKQKAIDFTERVGSTFLFALYSAAAVGSGPVNGTITEKDVKIAAGAALLSVSKWLAVALNNAVNPPVQAPVAAAPVADPAPVAPAGPAPADDTEPEGLSDDTPDDSDGSAVSA